jgi:flavin reductase (DIM6/NTAB) family NADH-FMN oxidoreductase RutF
MIPHALYVLTAQAGGRTAAATVSWVTQASFQPPLIVVGMKKDSYTYQVVSEAEGFVLNFLGKDQKETAQKFFKHMEPRDGMLGEEPFQESPVLKFPLFQGMAGHIECKVTAKVDQGDHVVVVAEVIGAEEGTLEGPLLLSTTGWQYGG